MKINVFFVLTATIGALSLAAISAARQTDETSLNRPMSCQLETEGIDSEGTWGGHEPLRSCAPCHGDRSEQTSSDELSLVTAVPELCYACHENYVVSGAWVHGPVVAGECLLCHEPHTSDNKSLLSKPVPELCYGCHDASALQLVANHSDKSYAHCGDCHVAHASPGRMLLNEHFLKTDAGLLYSARHPSTQPRPVFVDRRGTLCGLEGVEVVPVVDGLELFKRYGAAENLLKTEVERQLKRKGVRVLQPQEQVSKRSSLHVHLRLMEVPSFRRPGQVDALSGSFNVFLQQTVELLPASSDAKRRYCTATTWDTGAILIWGTSQIEDGLKEAVEVLVGRFSKDYLVANPKAHAPASAGGEG
ncbi:MAG: cytochrome c3 family protein [Sedimentisphaerales bacterium]|jgi:predicted CXXCH cytochrome family protein